MTEFNFQKMILALLIITVFNYTSDAIAVPKQSKIGGNMNVKINKATGEFEVTLTPQEDDEFEAGRMTIDKKYYGFGVVDVTKKYESLKDDIPTCTFDEVQSYIDSLIGEIETKADILILAGGDHLYWYNNAKYELSKKKTI